jgi:monothiol glutaredoxin
MTAQETIQQQITDHAIVLYMKGCPDFPQCGFSATVAHLLNQHDVAFFSVDVLDDPEVRDGIKVFSNWPTIPQLYVKGEFIGGCDIVRDLHERGELEPLLKQAISS